VSLREWVEKKEEEMKRKNIVELLFRPFLRWMDRNMETIVTEGLKQVSVESLHQASLIDVFSHCVNDELIFFKVVKFKSQKKTIRVVKCFV
jgi:hypothetical protein